jgi:hypothetical protein
MQLLQQLLLKDKEKCMTGHAFKQNKLILSNHYHKSTEKSGTKRSHKERAPKLQRGRRHYAE